MDYSKSQNGTGWGFQVLGQAHKNLNHCAQHWKHSQSAARGESPPLPPRYATEQQWGQGSSSISWRRAAATAYLVFVTISGHGDQWHCIFIWEMICPSFSRTISCHWPDMISQAPLYEFLNIPVYCFYLLFFVQLALNRHIYFISLFYQKDPEMLKSMFVQVYMERVYPLLCITNLKPFTLSDSMSIKVCCFDWNLIILL